MTTVLPAPPTQRVDDLLPATAGTTDLPYLSWVARRHGPEVASLLASQRRAQYGFCGDGHPRAVRPLYDDRGRFRSHSVFCPTCEGC